MAYFECMHELKLIVDLVLSRRPELYALQRLEHGRIRRTTPAARDRHRANEAEMKKILLKSAAANSHREWILENKRNAPMFKATRREERNHPIEEVGRRLRRLMPWIKAKEV